MENQIQGLDCDDGDGSSGPHGHSHTPISHDNVWLTKANDMEAHIHKLKQEIERVKAEANRAVTTSGHHMVQRNQFDIDDF